MSDQKAYPLLFRDFQKEVGDKLQFWIDVIDGCIESNGDPDWESMKLVCHEIYGAGKDSRNQEIESLQKRIESLQEERLCENCHQDMMEREKEIPS